MATAATVKRPPRPKTAKALVTPADFERIVAWLTTNVLVEREAEMRVLVRVMLAGLNGHMIGEPGVAKSLSLREFSRCVEGARYFEKQVHGLMPADALIGAYDMEKFAREGTFERKLDGYLPKAHVAFIDEAPRANGPTLDSLLPIMNTQERMAEHNGGMIATDLRVVWTGSNTWFDPENQQAQALSDRVTVMLLIEDIKTDEGFKEMLRRDHARRLGQQLVTRETITLDQLDDAQRQVREVVPGAEFMEKAAELRRNAKQAGLRVSPRRWIELGLLSRANAWMSGRDETIPEDLAIVEHGLWRDKDDIPEAHKLVLPFHGRFEREASKYRQEAAKWLGKIEAIRPQVEGVPPSEELEAPVLTAAIGASRGIDEVKARVDKVLAEAEKEKRDAAALRELANELLAVQMWLASNNLPTKYKESSA